MSFESTEEDLVVLNGLDPWAAMRLFFRGLDAKGYSSLSALDKARKRYLEAHEAATRDD